MFDCASILKMLELGKLIITTASAVIFYATEGGKTPSPDLWQLHPP